MLLYTVNYSRVLCSIICSCIYVAPAEVRGPQEGVEASVYFWSQLRPQETTEVLGPYRALQYLWCLSALLGPTTIRFFIICDNKGQSVCMTGS